MKKIDTVSIFAIVVGMVYLVVQCMNILKMF
jgi:hypothetical protein